MRHESGMVLPLVREGEEGYGTEMPEWKYKYVYTVTEMCIRDRRTSDVEWNCGI